MKKEPLFDLIQNLSQTEKAYFKKQAGVYTQKKSNNYLKLFDAIEKQEIYNEKNIKKEIGAQYFAQYKKHLFNKLLDVLRQYEEKSGLENQINIHLCNYKILKSKALLEQAKKELRRAKLKAKETENLPEIIKIIDLEKDLSRNENNLQATNLALLELNENLEFLTQALSQRSQLEKINLEINRWNKTIEWARSPEEQTELKTLIDHTAIKTQPVSIKNNLISNYTLGVSHYFLGEFEVAYNFFKTELELFELYKWLQDDEISFFKCLANNILLLGYLQKHNEQNKLFEFLKKCEANGKLAADILNYLKYLLHLITYHQNKQVDKGQQLYLKQNEKMKVLEHQFYELGIMYSEYTFATFYKVQILRKSGELKESIKILNHFLNLAEKKIKRDAYSLARLIHLILHADLDNNDYLEYEIPSMERYLSKHTGLKIEYLALNMIKFKLRNDKLKIEENRKKLLMLKTDNTQKLAFQFFDFESWAKGL